MTIFDLILLTLYLLPIVAVLHLLGRAFIFFFSPDDDSFRRPPPGGWK